MKITISETNLSVSFAIRMIENLNSLFGEEFKLCFEDETTVVYTSKEQ